MVCSSCGEKHKKTCNEFTKSVIEINNPETLVLLRKVVIPTSMGTEEQVPPAIGKYHNVILYYEANKHVYLYSSDGIPTYIEIEIPEALLDRIDDLEAGERNLQQEIDDLKNSPDVVDIVNTYSDLQAYDTSSLGDKDIIRVLNDETHNGESSYYRWNKQSETWTFIGTDSGRSIKTLTSADYNWNHDTQTETNPNCIAIWKLPSGIYYSAYGVLIAYNKNFSISYEAINIVSKHSNNVSYISVRDTVTSCGTVSSTGTPSAADGRIIQWNNVVNNLTETGYYKVLDARQGKVLKDLIDALPTPPTVVQTTGQSTTDVMSQKAVTDALAGAGGDITKFYFDESESAPSAHINIYKDKAMTQLATSADVWNAKDTGFELVGLEVASSDPLEVYEYNVYPAIFLQDESMNESATNVNWCTYSYGSISMWNMQNNLSYATYTNTTIPSVVQTIGQSTTAVMSQNAVTDELFHNGQRNMIQIGSSASSTGGTYYQSIAIGRSAEATYQDSTAIGAISTQALARDALAVGSYAYTNARYGVAIGNNSNVRYQGSVGLGAYSKPTSAGSVDIGSTNTSYGYNSSNYRLLTGVYDPQSAHDAATKGYVDTAVAGVSTNTINSTDWSALWQ